MTVYTAQFRSEAVTAFEDFEAETPEQALALAQAFYRENPDDLTFEPYDCTYPLVDEIEISGPEGSELAVWLSDDLRRRLAAGELLEALEGMTEAAQAVIDAWDAGDLAAAVRTLDGSIAGARAALARAEGGAA